MLAWKGNCGMYESIYSDILLVFLSQGAAPARTWFRGKRYLEDGIGGSTPDSPSGTVQSVCIYTSPHWPPSTANCPLCDLGCFRDSTPFTCSLSHTLVSRPAAACLQLRTINNMATMLQKGLSPYVQRQAFRRRPIAALRVRCEAAGTKVLFSIHRHTEYGQSICVVS